MSAPILNNEHDLAFPILLEDEANLPVMQVSSLFSNGNVTDDTGQAIVTGIAITQVDTTLGTWEYRVTEVDNWQIIDATNLLPENSLAFLLSAEAWIRFIPLTDVSGHIETALSFYAWNQNTAKNATFQSLLSNELDGEISLLNEALTLDITAVNDAPYFENIQSSRVSFTEGGNVVPLAINVSIKDRELLALNIEQNNYKNTYLQISRAEEARNEDIFSAINNLSFARSGDIYISEKNIGRVTNSNGIITLTFNENATLDDINYASSNIGYRNNSNAPDDIISFEWIFNDANTSSQGIGGALSGKATSTIRVNRVNDAPTLTLIEGNQVNYTEGSAPVALAQNVRLFDAELSKLNNGAGNYAGVRLTLSRTEGAQTEDTFSAIGALVFDNSNLVLNGINIGRISNSSGTLTIIFNSNATQLRVNQALSKIGYANNSNRPIEELSINWQVSDGNTGNQGSGGSLSTTATSNIFITSTDDIGRVLISGGTALGDTLRASLTDPDGIPRNVRYQWLADGVLIDGASGGTLLLNASMLRKSISVNAIYDDTFGSHTVTSTNTAPVGGRRLTDADDDYTGTSGIDWVLALEGDDYLRGYGAEDSLDGGSGNDTIDGGIGADHLIGGEGDDVYYVDNIDDSVFEINAGHGSDIIYSSATYTLSNYIENITLIGSAAINATGNNLDNIIIGNSAVNSIKGGPGNDTLDGGAGIDTLLGGIGDDIYYVDNTADVVIELVNAGNDTLYSNHSRTLSENQENLVLSGRAINGIGNKLNNKIIGNSLANSLNGGAGNDTLDGGIGSDTLEGGIGDDTYYVDNERDIIKEQENSGTDTIISSINYKLNSFIENLTLAGSLSIDGKGNELNNIITGNSSANELDGGQGADTLIGGLGNDIYHLDDINDVIVENQANGGKDTLISAFSKTLTGSLKFIENITLIGTAKNATGNIRNNLLIGNGLNNKLNGGDGDDTLNGGLGLDTMNGGNGDDTYYVNAIGDLIIENEEGGIDTIISSVSRTIDSNIENILFEGTAMLNAVGNSMANKMNGNMAANLLKGEAGNDTLDGGAGIDTLIGGPGNDIYYVDHINDLVVENRAQDGLDTIYSTVTRSLGTFQENIVLIGRATINATGNSLRNRLVGNESANALNGQSGADTMIGNGGNDIYYVDNKGDVVVEESILGGVDTVMSSISFTLNQFVDNLHLGTGAINGTGNNLNNYILGNSSANRLTGHDGADTLDGGSGSDTLIGGFGNDLYIIDNEKDLIIESTIDGDIDTVHSSVTRTLGSNLENLVLTGTLAINATGNILNNLLIGNSGANIITGAMGDDTLNGGFGADTLVGGLGNDVYFVDTSLDKVKEISIEGGTDTINSSVTWTLGSFIENLSLIGNMPINGTGNIYNNLITGNRTNNIINGKGGNDTLSGGSGQDTLIGGSGFDIFIIRDINDSLPGRATWDIITDFNVNEDRLDISEIDANLLTPGDQAFTQIISSTANFSAAGQLKMYNGILYGNINSDPVAEFAIQLTGLNNISMTQLIL